MDSNNKKSHENLTNDKASGDQTMNGQEVYVQLLSNRSINPAVFGPCFNLDPPKLNIQSDSNEDCQSIQDSDVNDVLFYIDEFENKYYKDETSLETLNLHYDQLISESKKTSTQNGTKHRLLLYAIKAKIKSSDALRLLGRQQEALMELERVQKRFITKDPHLINYINLKMSDLLIESFKYNKAMELLQKALIFNEALEWTVPQAQILMRMGILWALYKNFEYSKILLLEALTIFENHLNKNDSLVAECYYQLGLMSHLKEDYLYCERYTSLALELLSDSKKHNIIKIRCLNLLGSTFQIQGLQDNGINHFNQALDLCKNIQCKLLEAHILSNLGHVFRITGNLSTSQLTFYKALQLYKQILPSWNKKIKKLEQTSMLLFQQSGTQSKPNLSK